MATWLVTLKPGNTAPYLTRCRDQEEAEEREEKAESQGLAAEVYQTGTDDIFEAKRHLRKRIASDFNYEAAYSNYGAEEE